MVKAKSRAITTSSPEQELKRWSCSLFGNKSEIDVFVESAGRWETAAEVRAVGRFDAEEMASLITRAVMAYNQVKPF